MHIFCVLLYIFHEIWYKTQLLQIYIDFKEAGVV